MRSTRSASSSHRSLDGSRGSIPSNSGLLLSESLTFYTWSAYSGAIVWTYKGDRDPRGPRLGGEPVACGLLVGAPAWMLGIRELHKLRNLKRGPVRVDNFFYHACIFHMAHVRILRYIVIA